MKASFLRPLRLAATATLFAAVPAHAGSPVFETEREFTTAGDFNGDGTMDVLIIDKPTGLYRVGTRSAAPTPAFAPSRPTGVENVRGAALGRLNGTASDSFAVTSPAQNRVQIMTPTTSGYIEPRTVLNAGITPETMAAIDITTGPTPTAEDDLALVVADDPTHGHALREIRSNAGSWSIIDTGSCPDLTTIRGNPLRTSVAGTALVGFIRDAGATNTFHAVDPTGAGFTDVLVSSVLADNTRFITVPFETPDMDVVFYVPGSADVHVQRITPSGPGWVLGADDLTTFSATIAQIIPVLDTTGMRMLVRFDNGSVAIYSYTAAGGFGAPTAIAPSGTAGVLSGLVPIPGNAGFLLLYAPGVGQPSSMAVSFANTGSGWTQTGITPLPGVNRFSSYANILLLSDLPFRSDNPLLFGSYQAGDWSTAVSVGGGPFNVTAQVASYLGETSGIGASSAQVVGVASTAPGGTAVNQLHAQFSMRSFDSHLGSAVEDTTISPVAGTYNQSIQITFSGHSGGSTVYYRLGTSGAFTAYNPALPPWVFTDGTVQYYTDKPGTGPSPTHSASYSFTTPPALQDLDGDGVPDFVELDSGLDPTSGPDSDGDGLTDRDELAAGFNPRNPTIVPPDAPKLSTMILDAGFKSENAGGTSLGLATAGTTFTVTSAVGDALGSGVVGTGASWSPSYGRATVLNASGDQHFLIVRSEDNFTVVPGSGSEPSGRAKLAVVPVPELDGWSFGTTQGAAVTTGTAWSWGSTNWFSGNDNWDVIDDTEGFDSGWSSSQQSLTFNIGGAAPAALAWKTDFAASANRGGQPYVRLTVTPVTTLSAMILMEALSDALAARGLAPTIPPDGSQLSEVPVSSLLDLRQPSAAFPTAPVLRVAQVVAEVDAAVNGGDPGALALRKLARDVYARHEALTPLTLGDLPAPLGALRTFVSTGALPTDYQSGGSLTGGEMTDAATKLAEILGNVTTRSSATYTLYVRSAASPAGLTLLENSTGTTYAIIDGGMNNIALPSDIRLAAGTSLEVTAYNDVPEIAGYPALEVIDLSVSSLPSVVDLDSDSDLLADSWERHHFGSLDYDLYDIGDSGAFSLGEEYFRGTDPRWAGSSPSGLPTSLVFSNFRLIREGPGSLLRVNWPADYADFINVHFQATEDLSSWTYPSGFTATDAGGGVFVKALTFDRPKRFFRPVASLKR